MGEILDISQGARELPRADMITQERLRESLLLMQGRLQSARLSPCVLITVSDSREQSSVSELTTEREIGGRAWLLACLRIYSLLICKLYHIISGPDSVIGSDV